MAPKKTRKVRDKVTPYTRKPGPHVDKDRPKTSAKLAKTKSTRENLTLSDWLTVFAYIDNHPSHSQGQVVRHFSEKVDGALIFKQSTLSRKIKIRATLEERAQSTPTALSSKRARIVTRPDVEHALILWVRHMEERKETVSGPMLREKRKRFEELLQVPETERLPGEGWVVPFCKAYKIKEFRRHGEAASVDLAAVEAERKRVQELMKKYEPHNRWNFDETSLFPMYVDSFL